MWPFVPRIPEYEIEIAKLLQNPHSLLSQLNQHLTEELGYNPALGYDQLPFEEPQQAATSLLRMGSRSEV